MAQTARKVAPEAEMPTPVQQSIIAQVAEKPSLVLLDEAKLNEYVAALRVELDAEPATIDTAKGRDTIKAKAAGVARKKTAIDNARKSLTEDWRRKTATVNAVGKVVVEKLDALRDEVRAPLTAWEEKEEARKNEAQAIIDDMMSASIIREGDSIDEIRERLERIRGRNLSDEMFGPRIEMVTDLRDSTVQTLLGAIERLEQAEKDKRELEELRALNAKREQEELERLAEQQAEENRKALAAKAEQDAAERKRVEDARIAQEREDAAEAARQEAAAAAQREQEAKDRAAQEALDAANRRALQAEQRVHAQKIIQYIGEVANGFIGGKQYPFPILIRELDEKIIIDETFGDLQDEAYEALSNAKEKVMTAWEEHRAKASAAEEQEAREADRAHRSKIQREAKESIMQCGVDEAVAKLIVVAIVAGNIPNVSIRF